MLDKGLTIEKLRSVHQYLDEHYGVRSMMLIALGESVKTLDKLTDRKLLPTYPSIDWKGVMGVRDVIALHYFDVDPEAAFDIIKNDLTPLKQAIDYFRKQLFS